MRFQNKVVIVTGGAAGIGAATARLFVAEGARVALVDRDAAQGAALAKALGDQAHFIAADIAVAAQVEAAVAQAVAHFGQLDILVNNAGISGFGSITEITPDAWERMIATNLSSIFYASRAALPHLARAKGNIVHTASISGMRGDHRLSAYNAAKGGVVNLTRGMAIDYGRHGVRINAIAPGVTRTAMAQGLETNTARKKGWTDVIPLARLGEPEEMAQAIAFLASDAASYITGVILPVDGGMMAATGSPRHEDFSL